MSAAITNLSFFILLTFGLGAALAPDWSLKAGERLCLGVSAALIILYLSGFGIFVSGLNPEWLWCLPLVTMAIMVWRRQKIVAIARDPEAQSLLSHWAIFALWTLGLLALVMNYSGGGWAGDWLEHYQRALVFMQQENPHRIFTGSYTLTSRPPLANVITALFMEFSSGRFADYQIFTALLSTLFFFPGWLFYQRWKGPRCANALWVVVLMLNPLVAQNTTFAWTKLTCTFWILSGSYFLLRGVTDELGQRARIAGFLCLTSGLLTHYSTGPWILGWLIAYAMWFLRQNSRLRTVREVFLIGGLCSLLAFTWFGWAAHTFGWTDTGTSNSAAQEWHQQTPREHWLIPINNVVNTIIPHPFRDMNKDLIYQLSQGGWIRDYFFNIYQTNLPLAAGFSGLFVCVFRLLRPTPTKVSISNLEIQFWRWFLPFIIVIGIVVHTPAEGWGLTQICLQPLVIIGLAWIATRLPLLSPAVRTSFVLLLLWDAGVGIVLPFLIESHTYYVNALSPASSWGFDVTRLSRIAMLNYGNKSIHRLDFFADTLGAPSLWAATGLLALLVLMIIRVRLEAAAPSHNERS